MAEVLAALEGRVCEESSAELGEAVAQLRQAKPHVEPDETQAEVPFGSTVPPRGRRRWAWATGVGAVLLVLLGLCLFLLLRNSSLRTAVATNPVDAPPEPPRSVALSPWALVAEPAPLSPDVRGWTITSRTGRGTTRALAYQPQGRYLATANDDGVVRLLDADSGRLVRALIGHADNVRSFAWTPDGQWLASASEDRVIIWEAATGKRVRTVPHGCWHLAWKPDGRTLALEHRYNIELWQVEDGKLLRTLPGPMALFTKLAWAPDGNTLFSSSWDWTVRRWQVETDQPSETLFRVKDTARDMGWSPDGRLLAAVSHWGVVSFWRPGPDPAPAEMDTKLERVSALAWSPDSKKLALVGGTGDVQVWDVAARKLDTRWEENWYGITCVAWAPNGKTVVTGGGTGAFFSGTWRAAGAFASSKVLARTTGAPPGRRTASVWRASAGEEHRLISGTSPRASFSVDQIPAA